MSVFCPIIALHGVVTPVGELMRLTSYKNKENIKSEVIKNNEDIFKKSKSNCELEISKIHLF